MFYKTIKTSLSSVLKLRYKHDDITDAVSRVDQIVTRAWLFLRLYLLHNVVQVDENLIDCIYKIVATKTDKRGKKPNKKNQEIIDKLTDFANIYYKPHVSFLMKSLDLVGMLNLNLV